MKNKLRVGLLINDYFLSAWIINLIENINNSDHSEIVVVIKKTNPVVGDKNFIYNLWDNWGKVFFKLISEFDKKLNLHLPDALEQIDLRNIISCPEIHVKTKQSNSFDKIISSDVKNIDSFNIDVIIRLGFRNLKGKILQSAKYGIWSYRFGQDQYVDGNLTAIREVVELKNEKSIILEMVSNNWKDKKILFETTVSTDSINFAKNNNRIYWKASTIIPSKLKELKTIGIEDFLKSKQRLNVFPIFNSNKKNKGLTNYELLVGIINYYCVVITRAIKRAVLFDQWILLFKFGNDEKLSNTIADFKRIVPPKDRFWADPFPIKKDGKYYIFIEELIYKENKGKIAVMMINESGNYTTPKVIIEKEYHLSYPYLIEDGGELFMIPESSQNKNIELYICTNFPYEWEFKKVLISNIHAVDSTIFNYNNKYWLFCNVKENSKASSNDDLYLFYSDYLNSDTWTPHPLNPIVSSVKNSRPAGSLFTLNGNIYRPAQDCSSHYGYAINIMQIKELSETSYMEVHVDSIYPNWSEDLKSTHTFNYIENLTIIDAEIKRKYF